MAKGAFSGVIWGAVVAVAGAGGLSLAYPDFKPGGAQTSPEPETAQAMAPEAETQATENIEASVEEAQAPEVAVAPEADETDIAVADQPLEAVEPVAQEPAETEPEPTEPETARVDEEVFDPAVEPEAQAEAAPEPKADVDAEENVEPTEPAQVAEPAEPDVAEPEANVPDTSEAEVVEDDPVADEVAVTAEAPSEEETSAEAPSEEEPSEEDTANADAAQSITDEIIAALPKPAGTFEDLAPSVTTGRLPSLTSDESTADAPSALSPPPFERFASTFQNDSDKPPMAIVLIDTGDSELGVEALETFPYPLTFAVDTSKPDATAKMQIYRDKGFEVLALVDLPRGATPSDVEVAMSAHLSAVPEAVGILEGVDTGVQTSREMADQLTQIVLDSGHGMLLQKSGLNTARKLAEREGIPAGTVFRDFDGNGQSASVMRRFLDQAAFRAGQEGGVIMMGRLQAETISALLIWGLADRASRVALVPVSTVLKQDAPAEDG